MGELRPPSPQPRISTSSSASAHSLDLPSLQPLSHAHPLLSAPDFDPDAFLLSRIHIPLEELRTELRSFLAELREELVKLINEDYGEFLSLGTGLRGEEQRLKRLEGPLGSIRRDVESVRDILAEHQAKVQEKLDERAALREEKALLDLLQRLFDTISRAELLLDQPHPDEQGTSKLVARVAGEHTQIVYLLNKARSEGCAIVDVVEDRIVKIKSRISQDLSTVLLSEIENQNEAGLKQCLKTYELIEGWEEAEEVVRKSFKKFCRDTISSTALSLPTSPTVPQTPHVLFNPFTALRLPPTETSPLATLYNRILAFVSSYQQLMTVAEQVSDRFDFFARVIWPEVGEAIMDRLGHVIFAAGRPDELHKHYTITHKFISLMESSSPSTRSILSVRQSSTYAALERRWQLPVYFQLRWKEIVGQLEQSLAGQPVFTSGKGEDWVLSQSGAVWKALEMCWKEDIYIRELAPRFWRLTLQVVARYGTYLKSAADAYDVKEDDTTQEDAVLRFASAAIVDLDRLASKAKELEIVKELDLGDYLSLSTSIYTSRLTSILSRRCIDPLKLIRSIASQFRASPTPSSSSATLQPSYFIPSVFKPLQSLYQQQPALKDRHGPGLSTAVADSVFANYASTLSSVKKTEDLLRKHRKSKKTGFTSFLGLTTAAEGENGQGDGTGEKEEERLTTQMKVDIQALKDDAEGLGVEVEGLESWKDLLGVVSKPSEA